MWAMLIPAKKDTILRIWNQLWPFFFMMIWMMVLIAADCRAAGTN